MHPPPGSLADDTSDAQLETGGLAGTSRPTQPSSPRPWHHGMAPLAIAYGALIALLLVDFAFFLRFAWGAMHFPFGMDYTEGEIWRQARVIAAGQGYGDINTYPWIVFEYPPLFYVIANLAASVTGSFLMAGRAVSTLATLISAVMAGRIVLQGGRYEKVPAAAAVAAIVAALAVFTLSPIIAFATMVHVDNLALMFSLAGLALAAAALHRPVLLTPAMLAFAAAMFTKQTCIAAPLAVLLIFMVRDPRLTARACLAGAVPGLAITAFLAWRTGGGFLLHTLIYNINAWRLHNLLVLTGNVVLDCATAIELTLIALTMQWAILIGRFGVRGPRDVLRRIRTDRQFAFFALFSAHLVFSLATSLLAGKNGASVNYFMEPLYAACIWLGFLVILHIGGAAPAINRRWPVHLAFSVLLPGVLIWQVAGMPDVFLANMNALYGPTAVRQDRAELARLRGIGKPILSDDIAMVMLANQAVPIEPFIFAELARAGLWDEGYLITMLRNHDIGAVITYRDPGDATFAVRFGPRTIDAILKYYPVVIPFGDNRLRLPSREAGGV